LYLAVTVTVSYALWARDDAVWFDNPESGISWTFGGLVLLHLAVGALVGRWSIALLPVVWAVLSFGAIGHDGTSVGFELVFTAPFIWMPLLLIGVAIRKLVDPRERVAKHVFPAVIVLILFVGALAASQVARWIAEQPETRAVSIDEVAGTYADTYVDVALGASVVQVISAVGAPISSGVDEAAVPSNAAGWFFDPPRANGKHVFCYADVCVAFNRDGRVAAITLSARGTTTVRGVAIDDQFEHASDVYPDLTCVGRRDSTGPHCTGQIARSRWIWLGGDPINVIVVASEPLKALDEQ
jgi:hypothetical protein